MSERLLPWCGAIVLLLAICANAGAQPRVTVGMSSHVYVPTDEEASTLLTFAPRVTLSWVGPTGTEIGYLYAPLRLGELDMLIDHSLLMGRVWERASGSLNPYARASIGVACVNHRDYFGGGGESDTCSGPIVARLSAGARLRRTHVLGFAPDITIGVAFPTKPAAVVSATLTADIWFL